MVLAYPVLEQKPVLTLEAEDISDIGTAYYACTFHVVESETNVQYFVDWFIGDSFISNDTIENGNISKLQLGSLAGDQVGGQVSH